MIRTATVQMKPVWGDVAKNIEVIRACIAEAASQGARLIVLPEMCTTGYVFHSAAEILPFCEDKGGATFAQIAGLARRYGVYVVYGFAEKAGDKLYNSQNLVNPTGELLASYRKTHLYEQDTYWAASGDSGFVAVDTPLGRLGLGICMDLNFDDFVDFHIAARTDIIGFSACWLNEGFAVAPYWHSRLAGYQGAICIANSFGEERGIHFRGESSVFDRGFLVARAPLDSQQILLTEITLST